MFLISDVAFPLQLISQIDANQLICRLSIVFADSGDQHGPGHADAGHFVEGQSAGGGELGGAAQFPGEHSTMHHAVSAQFNIGGNTLCN